MLATDSNEERAIPRRSLHREVVERLRDMIVEGDIPSGQRIAETALCEEFGISRTPLREALKVLASEGLVELRPNRGARVLDLTAHDVEELFEMISGLERLAGELAAERMSAKDLRRLRDYHERMIHFHEKGNRPEYFHINQRVHRAIVEASGNTILATSHETLMVKVHRARFRAILSQERWDESIRQHQNLIDALEDRNGERAGAILLEHVRQTGEAIKPQILEP
jgi:DNA-binding GntR family transcriptional regulator